jgi:hypothetical protein
VSDGNYKKIHECEHDDRRYIVLYNPTTGGIIQIDEPMTAIYCVAGWEPTE